VPAKPAASEVNELGLPGEEFWRRHFSANNTRASDRLAAVYGCVAVISSTIAAMPLHLYRKRGDVRERAGDHPLGRLLAGRPNEAMTWTQFREAVIYNMVLRGNQHSRVFWRNGYPVELFPLPQGSVETKLSDLRRVVYEIGQNEFKVPAGTFGKPDVAHFKALTGDGLLGINPIEHCRMTMGGAVALTDYGRTSAEEGGPIRGILAVESTFKNPEAARAARIRLNEGVQAARASSGIALMEGAGAGSKFFPMTMSMRDAQYLESMQFSVIEICRIFNVPPHKIHDLTRATFNNIEHLSLEFYTGCILPWLTRLEGTLNDCLLTQADRDAGYFIKHNADGLLRGDMASRAEAQQKQIQNGTLTVNEARALEDRPPVTGGDRAFFPINHTTLEKIGQEPAAAGKGLKKDDGKEDGDQ
jgi:HK97 family phage portal protein